MRHVSDRFTALLDANVLYPFLIRDVLLSLAEAGLYRPLWTDVSLLKKPFGHGIGLPMKATVDDVR